MNNLSLKVKNAFEKLNKDNLQVVNEFYHPEIEFHDPVGTIKGSHEMKQYYAHLYQNVKSIRFDFSEMIEADDKVVAIWKMTLVTDKLNGGKPIVLDGNSVIKFSQGQAIYHRDYFDMGAFVYENIPGLGFVVKKIKERFKVEG